MYIAFLLSKSSKFHATLQSAITPKLFVEYALMCLRLSIVKNNTIIITISTR